MLCPYLRTKINFNAKGLDHIKMKSWNKTRLASDQYLRLKFLKLVPEILKNSGTLQEIKETRNFERVKNIENGQPYFWSVVPFWKSQKNELCQKIKKVFHEGDLEND